MASCSSLPQWFMNISKVPSRFICPTEGLRMINLVSVLVIFKMLTLCRNIHRFRQMRQYPKILIFWHEGIIMEVYEIIFLFIFQANLRNQEIVYQHNIAEKYYKLGRSELCWDIWGLFKNGLNITYFYPINYIITHMTMHFSLMFENLQISGPSLYNH